MITKEEVAGLKRQLQEKYEKDIAAIERVAALLAETNGAAQPLQRTLIPETVPVAQPAVETTPTLKAAIGNWFRRYPDQTFTVKQIVAKLQEQTFQFTTDNRDKSVHSTIWKLEKDGIVRTVVRGVGRRPSTYQLVAQARPHQNQELNGAG